VVEGILVAAAPQQVERLVDRDPVDPAEEAVLRIVVIGTLGNPKKHHLRDVACILGTAQDPECGVVDRALVPDYQLGERLAVTFPVPFDECPIGLVIDNYTASAGKLVGRIHAAGSISKSWSNPE